LSDAAIARTAARYRRCARFTRHYVASKLKRDPIHRALLDMARDQSFGEMVDIGCGRGQITVALLEAGLARSCIALDWAEASLGDLRMAGQGLPIETIARDMSRDFRVPPGDTALIIDVLYTMDRHAALSLLDAAADAARRRVVVRSLDPAAGWRGRFALALERVARPFWPHAGARVDPLPPAFLAAALQQRGFETRIMPCWGDTPFANVLIVAERQGV
jgi:hypothetical protein